MYFEIKSKYYFKFCLFIKTQIDAATTFVTTHSDPTRVHNDAQCACTSWTCPLRGSLTTCMLLAPPSGVRKRCTSWTCPLRGSSTTHIVPTPFAHACTAWVDVHRLCTSWNCPLRGSSTTCTALASFGTHHVLVLGVCLIRGPLAWCALLAARWWQLPAVAGICYLFLRRLSQDFVYGAYLCAVRRRIADPICASIQLFILETGV